MNRHSLTVVIASTLAIATALVLTGCRNDEPSSSRPSGGDTAIAPAPATTLTGTLRGGAAAIGGETTGWRLVGDGATGGFDVDVSKLQSRAKTLDGQRVTVTGKMTTRSWPERGNTPVLVAEKIEAASPTGQK